MEILSTYSHSVNNFYLSQKRGKEVLYIGSQSFALIEKLVSLEYQVHHESNLFLAWEELMCIVTEKRTIPNAILCDFHVSLQELYIFLNNLNRYSCFQNIPIFLLVNRKEEIDYNKIFRPPLDRVDDFIFIDSSAYVVDYKIRFYSFFNQARVHNSIISEPSRKSLNEIIDAFLKRAFDLVMASLLLIVLSPLLLLVALAIKIDSCGPIFYVSLRVGKGFKIFKFYKFRTMVASADKQLPHLIHLNQYHKKSTQDPEFIKIKNDPRITRVGKFLRKTSIDELPQLWNVIKGDMSLVGNRPLPIYEATTLTTDIFSTRFMAPAGITGLWQISKNKKANMKASERIQLDIQYASQRNFLSDMKILFSTPMAMIQKEEA
ncbi:MAG: sugar transferase [Thermoflavifilum sp.]|nr:sugar transferase [Thermoflavifilum sp.]